MYGRAKDEGLGRARAVVGGTKGEGVRGTRRGSRGVGSGRGCEEGVWGMRTTSLPWVLRVLAERSDKAMGMGMGCCRSRRVQRRIPAPHRDESAPEAEPSPSHPARRTLQGGITVLHERGRATVDTRDVHRLPGRRFNCTTWRRTPSFRVQVGARRQGRAREGEVRGEEGRQDFFSCLVSHVVA